MTSFDHVTVCVKNLAAAEFLFTKILGFEIIWSARDVGTDKSSMDTIVVQRGEAKVALMQGRDKTVRSQINEFIDRYGEGVQHIALEVEDIEAVCHEWEAQVYQSALPRLRALHRTDPTAAWAGESADVRARDRGSALQGPRKGPN